MNNREILRTLIIVMGLAISIFLCKVGVDGLPFAVSKNFDNKLIYLGLANIGIGACSIIGLLISLIYPSFFQDDNIIGVF